MEVYRGASAALSAPAHSIRASARVRVAGAGGEYEFESAHGATLELSGDDTSGIPAGRYAVEWEWRGPNNAVEIARGEPLVLLASLAADSVDAVPTTFDERVLAKAREALEAAAGSGEVSFASEGQSWTFESRSDLLTFVERLERKVARAEADGNYYSEIVMRVSP